MPGIQEDAAARVDGALQAPLQKRVVAKGQQPGTGHHLSH
jgi:hypothetical protein